MTTMRLFKTLVAACVLCWVATTIAQQRIDILPGKVVNGCGSTYSRFLVPDNIPTPFGVCRIESACNKHDLCYGKCLDGGDFSVERKQFCQYLDCKNGASRGNFAACRSPAMLQFTEMADKRKEECDASFYRDVIKDNPDSPACKLVSSIYEAAVRKLGGGAFNGRQAEEVGKALDHMNTMTHEQIKDLGDRSEFNLQLITPSDSLRLDSKRGIVNSLHFERARQMERSR